MRELKTKDIFKMSKILKKMELKTDFKDIDMTKTKDEVKKRVGIEFVKEVFENLHMAEEEVNEFLSDMVEMSVEEFKDLPLEKTFEIIKEFKNIPGLANFFKLASK